MASTKIGNLKAVLSMDSKKFDKGAKKAKKSVKGLSKSFSGLKSALVGLASAGAFGALTKSVLSAADAIGKTADRAGVTTTELQKMRFAFDQAGVGAEAVDQALLTFGKRLGKARQGIGALAGGLKGGEEALLDELTATNNVSEALDVMFRAMGRAETQTRKLAIADAAFGGAGLKMTSAFNDGSEAFFQAQKRMEKFGLVLDEKMIRNAERANDEISFLGQALKANFSNALGEALPSIIEVTKGLINLTKSIKPFFALLVKHEKELKAFAAGMLALSVGLKIAGLVPGKFKAQVALLPAVTAALLAYFSVAEAGVGPAEKLEKDNKIVLRLEKSYKALNKQKQEAVDPAKAGLEDKSFKAMLGAERARQERLIAEIQGRTKLLRLDRAFKKIEEDLLKISKRKGLSSKEENKILSERIVLFRDMFLVTEGLEKALEAHNKRIEAQAVLTGKASEVYDRLADSIIDAMQRGEGAMLSFKDIALNALFDIQREMLKIAVFQPLKEAGGGLLRSIGSAIGGSLFGGGGGSSGGGSAGLGSAGSGSSGVGFGFQGFASGGPVSGVSPIVVGEKGPEVFMPRGAGNIIPNDQLGGATNVTLNISTGVQGTVRAEIMGLMPQITAQVKSAVAEARQRGGAFSEAMGV